MGESEWGRISWRRRIISAPLAVFFVGLFIPPLLVAPVLIAAAATVALWHPDVIRSMLSTSIAVGADAVMWLVGYDYIPEVLTFVLLYWVVCVLLLHATDVHSR